MRDENRLQETLFVLVTETFQDLNDKYAVDNMLLRKESDWKRSYPSSAGFIPGATHWALTKSGSWDPH
jgi:hypothetical protein